MKKKMAASVAMLMGAGWAAAAGPLDREDARLRQAIQGREHTCFAAAVPFATGPLKNDPVEVVCELPPARAFKLFRASPAFLRDHFREGDHRQFISGGYEPLPSGKPIPFKR